MPIQGIEQPELIQVDETIRLRKYDGIHDFALEWYQDPEVVWLVDGVRTPYDADKLGRMYRYLNQHGELYWIEVLENGHWCAVGDVTFWQEDMPIVIGDPAYRGKGIGRKVIAVLAERGKELGYRYLEIGEIYDWNEGSRRCFESVGFQAYEKTDKGAKYKLTL